MQASDTVTIPRGNTLQLAVVLFHPSVSLELLDEYCLVLVILSIVSWEIQSLKRAISPKSIVSRLNASVHYCSPLGFGFPPLGNLTSVLIISVWPTDSQPATTLNQNKDCIMKK